MESTRLNIEGPDYTSYSLKELEDVLMNIDRAQFPDRYEHAKALYDEKRSTPTAEHENEKSTSPVRPNWSQLHICTRAVIIAFLILMAGSTVAFSLDFMAAKSWTGSTAALSWIVGLTISVLWFMALAHDSSFAQHLSKDMRGKVAIVGMPFVLLILNFIFIDQALPLALHTFASKSDAEETMYYEKGTELRSCHYRIKVLDNRDLEGTNLCLSRTQRQDLPQKGRMLVSGKRSAFGLSIESSKIQH